MGRDAYGCLRQFWVRCNGSLSKIAHNRQQHRPPMRTTKAERKRRREAALAKISNGHVFADTVAYVMSEWGCSRSTARRDVHWAHGELQLGLDAHDVQHLVTHLRTSLQRISLKAEGHQQYGASVGALRLLYEILLSRCLDNEAHKARRAGWGYGQWHGNTKF